MEAGNIWVRNLRSWELFKYRKRVLTRSVSKGTKTKYVRIHDFSGCVWVGVGRRLRQVGVNTFMGLRVPHL